MLTVGGKKFRYNQIPDLQVQIQEKPTPSYSYATSYGSSEPQQRNEEFSKATTLKTAWVKFKKPILALSFIFAASVLLFTYSRKLIYASEPNVDVEGVSYWPRLGLTPVYTFEQEGGLCTPLSSGDWVVTSGSWHDGYVDLIQDDDDGEECLLTSKDTTDNKIFLESMGAGWSQTDARFQYAIPCDGTDTIKSVVYSRVADLANPDADTSVNCAISLNPSSYKMTMELYVDGESVNLFTRTLNKNMYDMCLPFIWELTVGGNDDYLMCSMSQSHLGVIETIGSVTTYNFNYTNGGVGFGTDTANVSFIDLEVLEQTPTAAPTLVPTTPSPSAVPFPKPTATPTSLPSHTPTSQPTDVPTMPPTSRPSPLPSYVPTSSPTPLPSYMPTDLPSIVPSGAPSHVPTPVPSYLPTDIPSAVPSGLPSPQPTISHHPSLYPTYFPTISHSPSYTPTSVPSAIPSAVPSSLPSYTPTAVPSDIPSAVPSYEPTGTPSSLPTYAPSYSPSSAPSPVPSYMPTPVPTSDPTISPTTFCYAAAHICAPTAEPTSDPTTSSPSLSLEPTAVPTALTNFPTVVAFVNSSNSTNTTNSDCVPVYVAVAFIPFWVWIVILILIIIIIILLYLLCCRKEKEYEVIPEIPEEKETELTLIPYHFDPQEDADHCAMKAAKLLASHNLKSDSLFRISIMWGADVDLDIHFLTPVGTVNFHDHQIHGFSLDIDDRGEKKENGDLHIENISSCNVLPDGLYRGDIEYYHGDYGGKPIEWQCVIVYEGKAKKTSGTVLRIKETVTLCAFKVNDGNITFINS